MTTPDNVPMSRSERESHLAWLTMQEDKKRIHELVKDYIKRVPTENEYLRRKGAELLEKIGGADTGGDCQGTPTPGVAGEQAGTDDFEWHPGLDLS